ncbi:MAG TPA: PIN domain-containing protein [Spirochaetota bacterium]|nr:PIN domain-containing protein [Spirochaetota bacterium]HPC42323.1 PIN domain-containing protein [Spirochaetota bacterium]HPL17863.1 PIN domain-containing protein [Spirochaetota bacterium]HQF10227.1 PIN domain-containing protein [Spirochaetota bacterium]HQH99373.1 PIN domain-containing protein [Spirochaetota bacterium]
MVLVDTSIWIEHFRRSHPRLEELLNNTDVAIHPFIIGELACGTMKNREEILNLLQTLDSSPEISLQELLRFIEMNKLQGKGIGFIDINLLASSLLSDCKLWTKDKKLHDVAQKMGIAY